jgi:hypothetical protein
LKTWDRPARRCPALNPCRGDKLFTNGATARLGGSQRQINHQKLPPRPEIAPRLSHSHDCSPEFIDPTITRAIKFFLKYYFAQLNRTTRHHAHGVSCKNPSLSSSTSIRPQSAGAPWKGTSSSLHLRIGPWYALPRSPQLRRRTSPEKFARQKKRVISAISRRSTPPFKTGNPCGFAKMIRGSGHEVARWYRMYWPTSRMAMT